MPDNDLYEIADAVYREHGATPAAVACFLQKIEGHAEWTSYLLALAARDLLLAAQHRLRQRIQHQGEAEPPPRPGFQPRYTEEEQQRVASALERRVGWLFWPLCNAKKLGEACRADVEASAEVFEKNAAGNLVSARFLRKVAAKLSGDRKVADVLSEAQLERLHRQAERSKSATQREAARAS